MRTNQTSQISKVGCDANRGYSHPLSGVVCLQPSVDNESRNSRGNTDVLTLFSMVSIYHYPLSLQRVCLKLSSVQLCAVVWLRFLWQHCNNYKVVWLLVVALEQKNLTFSTPPVCSPT